MRRILTYALILLCASCGRMEGVDGILIGGSVMAAMPSPYENEQVENQGIGGQTCAQILARFDLALARYPKWLWLQCGHNDIAKGRTVDAIVSDIKTMREKAEAKGIRVFVLSLGKHRTKPHHDPYVYEINRLLKIDIDYAAWADSASQSLMLDGVHPNEEGYRDFFNWLGIKALFRPKT